MKTFDLSQNYFQLFGFNVNFKLNQESLTYKFQKLQGQYHPDNFVSANETESCQAMQVSSLLNEAYQTLKDPVKRAVYLLKLNGVDLATETDTKMDMDFLMEQMDLREKMEQVSIDEKGLDKIGEIITSVKASLATLMSNVAVSIEEKRWVYSRELLRKVQFIEKIKLDAEKIQENIEDNLY